MARILTVKFGKETIYFLIIFFLLFTILFLLLVKVFGVPYWWLFRSFRFSVTHTSTFNVTITVNEPLNMGDKILISVYSIKSGIPVSNATVSVYKDGGFIGNFYTNPNGEVTIEYLGGVYGIIIEKQGFITYVKVIPETPSKWVMGKFLSGIISAFLSFITAFFLVYYKKQPDTYS